MFVKLTMDSVAGTSNDNQNLIVNSKVQMKEPEKLETVSFSAYY